MVKTIIKIDGMACGMCESHMNDTIRNTFKVKKVSSSHTDKESVVISETELNEDDVKKQLQIPDIHLFPCPVSHTKRKDSFHLRNNKIDE